jgi:hypothetical protein
MKTRKKVLLRNEVIVIPQFPILVALLTAKEYPLRMTDIWLPKSPRGSAGFKTLKTSGNPKISTSGSQIYCKIYHL